MNLYPKLLHKNVLLLDDKIIGWKTGTTHWSTVSRAFNNRQYMWLFFISEDKLSVASFTKTVNNTEENNSFFQDTDFYKKFPIHEKFDLLMPY